MRLDVDLTALVAAASKIGKPVRIVMPDPGPPPIIRISDPKISDIEHPGGLLSSDGSQVLLYIQDHGSRVPEVLEDGSAGNKVHVAYCVTLQEMQAKRRYERYVATNDLNGVYLITGYAGYLGQPLEGNAKLNVCRNCLRHLNYRGYRRQRNKVFKEFDLLAFFETYSSFFPHMPSRWAGASDGDYTSDWGAVSQRYRAKVHHVCEQCGVDLRSSPQLLHVHHIDGVKTNNREPNLKAVCADCHRKEPNHGHMWVSHDDAQAIARARREQGLVHVRTWDQAFRLADPSVHGVLHLIRNTGTPLPEVGFPLTRGDKHLAQFELAWPQVREAVAISQRDIEAGNAHGWHVRTVDEALEHYDRLRGAPVQNGGAYGRQRSYAKPANRSNRFQ